MSDRRFFVAVFLAVVGGFGLRLNYVLNVVRDNGVGFGDAETYHLLGRVLADGEGYIRPREFLADGVRIPTAEFPPLWPMLLGMLDWAGFEGVTEQRLAGSLIGTLTIVVIALLGSAFGGRVVGVIAGVGAAIYPHLIVLDGSLLSESLYLLLITTVLLGVVRARQEGEDHALGWWIVAGIALGLAVVTRSESILLVPLLIAPAARHPDRRSWLRAIAIGSAGVVLVLTAWTGRNLVSLGHVQPFTNNSGTLVAGANCPAVYRGSQIGLWRSDCVTVLDVGQRDEVDGSAFLRREGLDYAWDHRSELPAVMAVRVARTFGVWDVRVQLYFEALEGRDYNWSWAGWYMWVSLVPLAGVGLVSRRRRGSEIWPLMVPVGIVVFTVALTYGNQRFRVMAEPSMLVFAALGIERVARSANARLGSGRRQSQPVHAAGGSS